MFQSLLRKKTIERVFEVEQRCHRQANKCFLLGQRANQFPSMSFINSLRVLIGS